ncbi:MAG: hypothetical protein ACRCXZ_07275, partial [Patescibacteria group bacterium]
TSLKVSTKEQVTVTIANLFRKENKKTSAELEAERLVEILKKLNEFDKGLTDIEEFTLESKREESGIKLSNLDIEYFRPIEAVMCNCQLSDLIKESGERESITIGEIISRLDSRPTLERKGIDHKRSSQVNMLRMVRDNFVELEEHNITKLQELHYEANEEGRGELEINDEVVLRRSKAAKAINDLIGKIRTIIKPNFSDDSELQMFVTQGIITSEEAAELTSSLSEILNRTAWTEYYSDPLAIRMHSESLNESFDIYLDKIKPILDLMITKSGDIDTERIRMDERENVINQYFSIRGKLDIARLDLPSK